MILWTEFVSKNKSKKPYEDLLWTLQISCQGRKCTEIKRNHVINGCCPFYFFLCFSFKFLGFLCKYYLLKLQLITFTTISTYVLSTLLFRYWGLLNVCGTKEENIHAICFEMEWENKRKEQSRAFIEIIKEKKEKSCLTGIKCQRFWHQVKSNVSFIISMSWRDTSLQNEMLENSSAVRKRTSKHHCSFFSSFKAMWCFENA